MTVGKYLTSNPCKAAYTIKQGRKSCLCNLLEAYKFLGNKEIRCLNRKNIILSATRGYTSYTATGRIKTASTIFHPRIS